MIHPSYKFECYTTPSAIYWRQNLDFPRVGAVGDRLGWVGWYVILSQKGIELVNAGSDQTTLAYDQTLKNWDFL